MVVTEGRRVGAADAVAPVVMVDLAAQVARPAAVAEPKAASDLGCAYRDRSSTSAPRTRRRARREGASIGADQE